MTRQTGFTASSTTSTRRRVARTAIVDRGVGAVHVHQATDGGLKLKNGLQGALGTLGLIGRVGGIKFAASCQGVHGPGNLVGVVARAQKRNHVRAVFGGQILKIGADRGLALSFGQIEALGPHIRRDVGKKIIQSAHADHGEHFLKVVRRVGNVGHNYSSTLGAPAAIRPKAASLKTRDNNARRRGWRNKKQTQSHRQATKGRVWTGPRARP